MHRKQLTLTALVVLAVSLSSAKAQNPPPPVTVINVSEMCCNGCVRKVCSRLYEVRGVKLVQCSVQKKVVVVTPQQGVVLSPRALWEAIEKAEDRPVRLAGPSGTFTSKPRS
jgi:Cu+-exporting ATPase